MSSGLIIERGSEPSVLPSAAKPVPEIWLRMLLVIGTPSTTISGALLPKIDLLPRSVILEAPPAPPAEGVMVTPEILPSMLFTKLGSCTFINSSERSN